MASVASPDPCPERALVGKLMCRQRMEFRSRVIARYSKNDQRPGVVKHGSEARTVSDICSMY
jgi:hypothetical protein